MDKYKGFDVLFSEFVFTINLTQQLDLQENLLL